MDSRTYTFNKSTLTVIFGDITTSKASVIVSSDDTDISMGGGVSRSILLAGGEEIQRDAQRHTPSKLGDVVVSTSGNLPHQKFVFHCMTKDFHRLPSGLVTAEDLQEFVIRHSADKCFRILDALELDSIAFPYIGAGNAEIPMPVVGRMMAEVISANLSSTNRSLHVELYLYAEHGKVNEMDYIDLFENLAVNAAASKIRSSNYNDYSEEHDQESDLEQIPSKSPDEMEHEVFISYARKDIPGGKIKMITDALDEKGIKWWMDTSIHSGEHFQEVITKAIQKASSVVFIVSENSSKSKYVTMEIAYSVSLDKHIIPVRLDNSPYHTRIDMDMIYRDYLDFTSEAFDRQKLYSGIQFARIHQK